MNCLFFKCQPVCIGHVLSAPVHEMTIYEHCAPGAGRVRSTDELILSDSRPTHADFFLGSYVEVFDRR